ncbi:MAG: HAMP domain-containing sensor histidine kinase [Spirochaetales bacterium]|nr:HAMP domain-containing sensor histidine kinase [Spirochaetales bacterium]
MTLERRFSIIILGTFIVPLLIIIFFIIFLAPDAYRHGDFRLRQYSQLIMDAGNAEAVKDFDIDPESIPQNIQIWTVDEDGGVQMLKPAMASYSDKKTQLHRLTVLARSFYSPDGERYAVLVGTVQPFSGIFLFLSVIVCIFVFIFVSTIVSLKSINSSLKILNNGTERVAAGDLEVPVELCGDENFKSLARSFNLMQEKLKLEYERRSRFFMSITHDLKTPLSSITGYTEALLEGMAEDRCSEEDYLRIIKKHSDLLEHRIQQLLEFSIIESSTPQLSEYVLTEFLLELTELVEEYALVSNRKLNVCNEIPDDLLVSFDGEQIRRAFENLVRNSFSYGIEDSEIQLIYRVNEYNPEIIIRNHIKEKLDEENLHLIFEPFYRSDASRKGQGTGLGLATVSTILSNQNWNITARCPDENLIEFCIEIPDHLCKKRS